MRCVSLELKYKKLSGADRVALMNEFGAPDTPVGQEFLAWSKRRTGGLSRTLASEARLFEKHCHFFIKSVETLLNERNFVELRERSIAFLEDNMVPKALRAEVKHLVAKSYMREGQYRLVPELIKEALNDLRNEAQDYLALGLYCDLTACYYNLDEVALVEANIGRIEAELRRHDFAPRIRQRTLNLLGQLYLDRGRFDEARRCYRESYAEVEHNPSSHEALRLRLYLFGLEKDSGRMLEARSIETRLSKDIGSGTASDVYDFHRNCAGMRLLEGDREGAEAAFKLAEKEAVDDMERALLRLEWCEKAIAMDMSEDAYRERLNQLEALAPACGATYEWIVKSLRAASLANGGQVQKSLEILKQSAAYFLSSYRFHDLVRDFRNLVRVSPRADEGVCLIELAAHICAMAASEPQLIPASLAAEAKKVLQQPLPVDAASRLRLDTLRELIVDANRNILLDFREQPMLWKILMVFAEDTRRSVSDEDLVGRIWNEQHFNSSHPPKIRRSMNRLKIKFQEAGIRLAPVKKASKGYVWNPDLALEVLKSS